MAPAATRARSRNVIAPASQRLSLVAAAVVRVTSVPDSQSTSSCTASPSNNAPAGVRRATTAWPAGPRTGRWMMSGTSAWLASTAVRPARQANRSQPVVTKLGSNPLHHSWHTFAPAQVGEDHRPTASDLASFTLHQLERCADRACQIDLVDQQQ